MKADDSTGAWTVTADDVGTLVTRIFDRARRFPLVVISVASDTGLPRVSPDLLVGHVKAVVAVLDSVRTSEILSDAIGHDFNTYGGALRVMWPGATSRDHFKRHPLFFAYPEDDPTAVADRVIGYISGTVGSRRAAPPEAAPDPSRRVTARPTPPVRPPSLPGGTLPTPALMDRHSPFRTDPAAPATENPTVTMEPATDEPPETIDPPAAAHVEASVVEEVKPDDPPGYDTAVLLRAINDLPELLRGVLTDEVDTALGAILGTSSNDLDRERSRADEAEVDLDDQRRRAQQAFERATLAERELRAAERERNEAQRARRDAEDQLLTEQVALEAATQHLTEATEALAQARGSGSWPPVVYADPDAQIRYEIEQIYLVETQECERAPIRPFTLGPDFVGSLDAAIIDRRKVLSVCVEVLNRTVHQRRTTHPATDGGASLRHPVKGNAWRAYVKNVTPGAPRLLYWDDGERVEFARAAHHDDYSMS